MPDPVWILRDPCIAQVCFPIKKEWVGDLEVAPFDVVQKHIPAAPKYREEIAEILEEGLVTDSGCMVIQVFGEKDGKSVKVETHVMAPGLVDSTPEKLGLRWKQR